MNISQRAYQVAKKVAEMVGADMLPMEAVEVVEAAMKAPPGHVIDDQGRIMVAGATVGTVHAMRAFVLAWDEEITKAGVWHVGCAWRRVINRMQEARWAIEEARNKGDRR